MDLSTITVSDFKARFYRDFTYATVPDQVIPAIPDPEFVQDQDITNAFGEAQTMFNQCLFGNDASIAIGYLLLTAHLMCLNINAAMAGLNSTGSFPVTARSVGSVSESYQIPTEYTENPILAGYTQTAYGLKYLAMVLPMLVGNVGAVWGGTTP